MHFAFLFSASGIFAVVKRLPASLFLIFIRLIKLHYSLISSFVIFNSSYDIMTNNNINSKANTNKYDYFIIKIFRTMS